MKDYECLDNNGNYIDYFVILEDNKKMLKELEEKDKEIERLNNIIEEYEKFLISVKQFAYLDK